VGGSRVLAGMEAGCKDGRFLPCKNLKLKNGMEAIFEQRKG
jgi:hypothetical protein